MNPPLNYPSPGLLKLPGASVLKNVFDQIQKFTPTAPKTIPSIYGSGGGGAGVVTPPKLDIAAINARARASAEGAVNPFYTKQLNEFLAQQAAQRQQRQTQYQTNVTNLEDQLKQTEEQNALTGARTTEDVAQNQGEINQNADEFQTDSGQAFDDARLEIARQASTGGLGAQKNEAATTSRNTQEGRQEQKFQQARQEQELFKSRTFEDLAKSNLNAKTSKEKGIKQQKFDLDSYIENSVFDEQNKRNDLELSRQATIDSKAAAYAKDAYNRYITGIANPAQRVAAANTYGGSF